MRFRFAEKLIPKRRNSEVSKSRFCAMDSLILEFPFWPNQAIFVFSLLIFKPEKLPNISNIFKADSKERSLPSKSKVVSYANCVSLSSFPLIVIPIISEFIFISKARISAARRNMEKKYGERGSPCRHPLQKGIHYYKYTHWKTYDLTSVLKSCIQRIKLLLYP